MGKQAELRLKAGKRGGRPQSTTVKAWISKRLGGDQIDYADESPRVRQWFAEALAGSGLTPRMDAAYEAERAELPPLVHS